MSVTTRQNRLLVSEDWKKVYQSFRNADFQSYDFENLRRTMIDYIRTNYPEDFNDYIESSEYLALIDLIAFLGQSIAFRIDLNARENFLELADRRESVLRLARMISYNAKRNIASRGLLKFTTISTTESVIDSNGRNLSGQTITWNDPSNANWYDQFIKVVNAALPSTQQFGRPADSATIYGIPTEQYRFNSANADVPVFAFTKTVNGRSMNFEITSCVKLSKEVKDLIDMFCKNTEIHLLFNIDYKELLLSVWNIIRKHINKDDILEIFEIEMLESSDKCFTGRFGRLINVLNGFDDRIQIIIDEKTHIGNIISNIQIKLEKEENYTIEKHKELSKIKLIEDGINLEMIETWISYIQ